VPYAGSTSNPPRRPRTPSARAPAHPGTRSSPKNVILPNEPRASRQRSVSWRYRVFPLRAYPDISCGWVSCGTPALGVRGANLRLADFPPRAGQHPQNVIYQTNPRTSRLAVFLAVSDQGLCSTPDVTACKYARWHIAREECHSPTIKGQGQDLDMARVPAACNCGFRICLPRRGRRRGRADCDLEESETWLPLLLFLNPNPKSESEIHWAPQACSAFGFRWNSARNICLFPSRPAFASTTYPSRSHRRAARRASSAAPRGRQDCLSR